MPLIPYDVDVTAELLLAKDAPVMETTLMRELDRLGWPSDESQSLFVRHFSLFHVLYRIKSDYGRRGFYMHIDTMRIRLLALPSGGCENYDPHSGKFCALRDCTRHRIKRGIVPDYFTSFYLDKTNIAFESVINTRYIDALIYFGCNKRNVDEALRFFGLSSPDKKLAAAAYYRLAKKCHPDHGGSEETMKLLNSHYAVLKRCFF